MIIIRKALGRRTFLRGVGAAAGLPLLDAMVPALSFDKVGMPVRMAFVYVPIGAIMDLWSPTGTGMPGELPRIVKPMGPFHKDMLLRGNLTHNGGAKPVPRPKRVPRALRQQQLQEQKPAEVKPPVP